VHRRGGRKRALGTRARMLVPQWPNDRWSVDFAADQFIDGRRLGIFVVVERFHARMPGARRRQIDLGNESAISRLPSAEARSSNASRLTWHSPATTTWIEEEYQACVIG
jgi:hypothetical protein